MRSMSEGSMQPGYALRLFTLENLSPPSTKSVGCCQLHTRPMSTHAEKKAEARERLNRLLNDYKQCSHFSRPEVRAPRRGPSASSLLHLLGGPAGGELQDNVSLSFLRSSGAERRDVPWAHAAKLKGGASSEPAERQPILQKAAPSSRPTVPLRRRRLRPVALSACAQA